MRLLSLFSGCGGMDIGFEGGFVCHERSVNTEMHPDWIVDRNRQWVTLAPTLFDTVFANDIRPDAKAAWISYFGRRKENANEIYHLESIVDLVKRAKAGENIFPQNIDIVTGGFPCNDFSVSGLRKGFDSHKSHTGGILSPNEPTEENRGKLYMWMREVVSITKPKIFIAENVKGLTNLGDAKQIIEHDFAEADGDGYIVVPAKVLLAADYGAPQSRERVIFFGFRKSALKPTALKELQKEAISERYNPYPAVTHGKGTAMPYMTCREAFTELVEPEFASDPSQANYSRAQFIRRTLQGHSEIRLDGIGPTIRAEHHGNIEFRRLSAEHGGTHTDELAQGLQERRLSVRECARIQTFPDDYQFILAKTTLNKSVSASDAYKIIGNAVPPILAYNIAKNLESKWDLYFRRQHR